jgi:hypothetical protein
MTTNNELPETVTRNENSSPGYLIKADAANLVQVMREALDDWLARGFLPHQTVGGAARLNLPEVESYRRRRSLCGGRENPVLPQDFQDVALLTGALLKTNLGNQTEGGRQ